MNTAAIVLGVITFIVSVYYLGYFAGHDNGWSEAKHIAKIDYDIEKQNKNEIL